MKHAWTQFKLLLWKNYLLQKRKPFITIIELVIPVLFAIILIYVRHNTKEAPVSTATRWRPFSVERLQPLFCPSYALCFLDYWRLHYAPKHPFTDRVMHRAHKSMGFVFLSHIKDVVGFETEDELVTSYMAKCQNASTGIIISTCDILGGIIFTNIQQNSSLLPQKIEYKIRLPYTPRTSNMDFHVKPMLLESNWRTTLMFPEYPEIGPRNDDTKYSNDPGYMQEGFLTLQKHIDQAIIQELAPRSTTPQIPIELWRFPYPPHNGDPFILVLQSQFPLIIMLSYIFTALQIVKDLVHEKERKLKETMKMMGLSGWLHWTAWFTKYFLFMLISTVIMTVFFTVPMGQNGRIVGHTSWSVLLVYLLLYSIATINFCFAVSVFFSKANSGATAGGILFFLSHVPYVFLQKRYSTLSLETKLSTSLLSNIAMAYGSQIIGMFEGSGAGVQWATINQGASVDDSFTMLWVFSMLIVDAVLYGLIAWYIEVVWPGKYGVPQPWYFPVMGSYWCGTVVKDAHDLDSEITPLLTSINSRITSRDLEPIGLETGIRIENLRKLFTTGGQKHVAVDKMTLNIYEGQITVLLGHNGAGKTTIMSMLTGFFPPTSGSALVNGHDIRTDISGVRQSLGVCPQHNVLFDSITVEEHLKFFAKLKGCSTQLAVQETEAMLHTLGLEAKRKAQTKTLSGGLKRKLSVGIALIGGSKVLILDEPTSGMDPAARRQTWDILQKQRAGRTILLITHHMNEADILGDRIAIMSNGVLQCCGTPLFLKNKYGAGYRLGIVQEDGCDIEAVTAVIQKHVPTSYVKGSISLELSFILPQEDKSHFAALFDELEKRTVELKIASYGVAVTTMEEVFLRIGDVSSDTSRSRLYVSETVANVQESSQKHCVQGAERNTGLILCVLQYRAMFWKRVLHTVRNWLLTLTQLMLPLLFTLFALIIIQTLPKPADSPPLTLNTRNFGENIVLYSHGKNPSPNERRLTDMYAKQFDGTSSRPQEVKLSVHAMDDYLLSVSKDNLVSFNSKYMLAAELLTAKSTLFFNAQAYHTAAITLNALSNAYLKYSMNSSYSLTTINHPFPRTAANKLNEMVTKGYDGYFISLNVMFGMAFLTSSFVWFLIQERNVKAKHCQFMSGVGYLTFWAATFTWDFINYIVPCILIVVALVGFDVHAFSEDRRYFDIVLLFVLYGWSVLPCMYLLSFLFTVPASGFVWLTMMSFLTGICTVLSVEILSLPGLNTVYIAKTLEWIFLPLLPHFCLCQGLGDFFFNHKFLAICTNQLVETGCLFGQVNPCCKGICGDQCVDYSKDYLSWQAGGIGRHLVFLACQGCVYFSLLFLIESHILQYIWYCFRSDPMANRSRHRPSACMHEDDDVTAERQRIACADTNTLLESDTVILQDLTKYYGSLLAVDRLSLGIKQGECFGLLGINGAGKTTTFRMLTGDETVSNGDAHFRRFSIRKDMKQVRQQLGYCPQFDALIGELTGRETLVMYARLRGVPEPEVKGHVDTMIQDLLLVKYADRLVKTYSGGNMRKLSTATALIGDPPIIFLDEPSTGMDPMARHSMWKMLSELRNRGRTVVMTSHSMDECEALCTKISIMVNGQIKCLGTPQHLRNKYADGYTLIVKVARPGGSGEPDVQPLMEHIQEEFPGSVLKDVHQGMVYYHIPNTTTKWAELFRSMEHVKDLYSVEDYSISQTTMDQVFLNFARSQTASQETSAGCYSFFSVLCRCNCIYQD